MEEKFDKLIIIPTIVILIVLIIYNIVNTGVVPKKIINNYYYRINDNDEVEVIRFNNDKFNYYNILTGESIDNYSECSEYSYDKTSKIINLKCPIGFKDLREIKVDFIEENYIILDFQDNKKRFYKTQKMALLNAIIGHEANIDYYKHFNYINYEEIDKLKTKSEYEILFIDNIGEETELLKVLLGLNEINKDIKINYLRDNTIETENQINLYLIGKNNIERINVECDLTKCDFKNILSRKGV